MDTIENKVGTEVGLYILLEYKVTSRSTTSTASSKITLLDQMKAYVISLIQQTYHLCIFTCTTVFD